MIRAVSFGSTAHTDDGENEGEGDGDSDRGHQNKENL